MLTGISVQRKLGNGAFGAVYLGKTADGILVALKILQEKGKVEELKMEAKILK
jgi:predicted Ser/Thr protein kinase